MDGPERWHDLLEATYEEEHLLGDLDEARTLLEDREMLRDIPWMAGSGRLANRYHLRSGDTFLSQCDIYERMPLSGTAVCDKLFYGMPDRKMGWGFIGLCARFNTCDPERAQCGANTIDGGADGGSSLWLVGWHPKTVYAVYPKGSTAGLERPKDGEAVNSVRFTLVIEDWRYVARAANLRNPSFGEMTGTAAEMARRVKKAAGVRYRFYAGPTLQSALQVLPEAITTLEGIPLHIIPELRDDEPKVI